MGQTPHPARVGRAVQAPTQLQLHLGKDSSHRAPPIIAIIILIIIISPGTNFCCKTTQNLSGVTVCIISHSCVQVCWFGRATGSVEICSRVSCHPGTSRLPGAQPFLGDGRECGDRQKCTGPLQAWAQNWCTGHSYLHSTC